MVSSNVFAQIDNNHTVTVTEGPDWGQNSSSEAIVLNYFLDDLEEVRITKNGSTPQQQENDVDVWRVPCSRNQDRYYRFYVDDPDKGSRGRSDLVVFTDVPDPGRQYDRSAMSGLMPLVQHYCPAGDTLTFVHGMLGLGNDAATDPYYWFRQDPDPSVPSFSPTYTIKIHSRVAPRMIYLEQPVPQVGTAYPGFPAFCTGSETPVVRPDELDLVVFRFRDQDLGDFDPAVDKVLAPFILDLTGLGEAEKSNVALNYANTVKFRGVVTDTLGNIITFQAEGRDYNNPYAIQETSGLGGNVIPYTSGGVDTGSEITTWPEKVVVWLGASSWIDITGPLGGEIIEVRNGEVCMQLFSHSEGLPRESHSNVEVINPQLEVEDTSVSYDPSLRQARVLTSVTRQHQVNDLALRVITPAGDTTLYALSLGLEAIWYSSDPMAVDRVVDLSEETPGPVTVELVGLVRREYLDYEPTEPLYVTTLVMTPNEVGGSVGQNFDLSVYPNPSNGAFVNLDLSVSRYQAVEIAVWDVLGRRVDHETVEVNSEAHIRLDIRGLSAGVYQVQAITNHGSVRKSLTVVH